MSEVPAEVGAQELREEVPTEAVDRLVAEAAVLAGQLEEGLAALEAALGHLEEGRYGLCEICGAPIGGRLLDEDPAARRCPVHGAG